jgi:alpha-tubulin suppressor-like RCC1 family protein
MSRLKTSWRIVPVALMAACDWGIPTATIQELAMDPAETWPSHIGVGTSEELEIRITVADGSAVTAAPVTWISSDTSVVKVVVASPPEGAGSADSLAARLRATITGVGRGAARITVLADSLAGFSAPRFEHEVSVRERWIDVSGGGAFTCGVNFENRAYCWGSGELGELGNGGSRGAFSSPQPVVGGRAFSSIDSGWDHACARSTDGLVYCWGFNFVGELGSGDALSQFVPTQVALGRPFHQITAGAGLTCGTLDAVQRGVPDHGTWALCWGGNAQGQIGANLGEPELHVPDPRRMVGTLVQDPQLGEVFTALTFSSVSAGGTSACGIVSGGAGSGAWCWGDNGKGQLGSGNFVDGNGVGSSYATAVQGPALLSVVTSLTSEGAGEPDSGARAHACGLTEAGAAWCWGSNDLGQLGTGGVSAVEPVPVATVGGHGFTQISLGEGHSCGLHESGAVYCWGRNDYGQVGNGQAGGPVSEPVAVSGAQRFAKVSAGAFHTCALTVPEDGGAIYCWGRNDRAFGRQGGQLGNGTFTHSAVPTRVIESPAQARPAGSS